MLLYVEQAALVHIIRFYYISTTVLILVINVIPPCHNILIPYGKTRSSPLKPARLRDLLSVPKRWFWHFYVVGVICCVGVWCLCWMGNTWHDNKKIDEWLGLVMMTFQVARRLYECLFVERPSNAEMHVLHYIAGVLFYLITPFAIVCESLPPISRYLIFTI